MNGGPRGLVKLYCVSFKDLIDQPAEEDQYDEGGNQTDQEREA
jgi:hypothetical protein